MLQVEHYPIDINKLASYNDPLIKNAWTLFIPDVPGSNGDQQATKSIQIQAQSVGNLINYDINDVKVNMQRLTFHFAGAMKHQQTTQVSFFDTSDSQLYKTLQSWRDVTVDYDTGLNYSKNIYSTTAFLYHYGVNGNTAIQLTLNNLWLRTIKSDGYEVGNDNTKLFMYTCEFVFDFLDNPVLIG